MRHGQTSIFLKPFIVIIFALLLIFVIQSVFNFQVGVEEDKQRFDFLQNFQTTFLNTAGCLEPDRPPTASRAVLSENKLQTYTTQYSDTEPDCAEDFVYGYNVSVFHNCLYQISSNQPADCSPTTTPYTFGETAGSTGDSLDNQLTLTYPVLIQVKPTLRVPGTMRIEMRSGDLEQTYGFMNKVIKQGKTRGNPFSLRLSITNSQRICTDGDTLCLGGDACLPVKTGSGTSIEQFSLPPGSHLLNATYQPGPDELAIEGGVSGGC